MIIHRLSEPAERLSGRASTSSSNRYVRQAGALLLAAVTIAGCVSVSAPEEPIVIELNVNIKQEVVYRLAPDAGNTIQQNPEIF